MTGDWLGATTIMRIYKQRTVRSQIMQDKQRRSRWRANTTHYSLLSTTHYYSLLITIQSNHVYRWKPWLGWENDINWFILISIALIDLCGSDSSWIDEIVFSNFWWETPDSQHQWCGWSDQALSGKYYEKISRGGGGDSGPQSPSVIKNCQGVAGVVTTLPSSDYLPDD